MTIILFIILETGWGNRREDSVGAGRLLGTGDHILYVCACVCVHMQIKCFYVYMQVCIPCPPMHTHSHVSARCIQYCRT